MTHQDHIIEHILHSKSFADSEKSRNLLSYLFQESKNKRIPREIDIAIDVFQRGKDFNPAEDTIVRVALHKLRQKLVTYYSTEGKRDRERISIPKGQYQLVIEKSRTRLPKNTVPIVTNVFLLLCLGVVVFMLFQEKQNIQNSYQFWDIVPADHPVWRDVMQSGEPVVLALGDLYLIRDVGHSITDGLIFRDTQINSDWQFNKFIESHPEYQNRYEPHDFFFFFPEYSYSTLVELLPNFICQNVNFSIVPASNLTAEDFTNSHIIFIGYFKTTTSFHNLFNELAVEIDVENEIISGLDESIVPDGKVMPQDDPNKHHSDISYFAKVPGSNGHSIYLFMGFRLAGVQDVVKQFSSRQRLQEIESILTADTQDFPQYFQLVSKVDGYARKEVHSEILQVFIPQE